MAVILAASMVMSSGVTAFAGVFIGITDFEPDKAEVEIGSDPITDGSANDSNKEDGKVETEKAGDVKGSVEAYSTDIDNGEGKSAEASVTVNGDVEIDGGNDETGVKADASSYSATGTGATSNTTVEGSVEVRSDRATGAQVTASSSGSKSNSTANVTVKEEVSVSANEAAVGVGARAESSGTNSNAAATVKVGSVSAESGGGSTGIRVNAENQSSSSENPTSSSNVNVKVDNSVESTSYGWNAVGIDAEVSKGAKATVTVGGDVVSKVKEKTTNNNGSSNMDQSSSGTAYGIQALSEIAGDLAVNVGGDLKASSNNGEAYTILTEGVTGNLDIDVGGSVTQDGSGGYAIALPDSCVGNITITVGENVTATTTAVNIVDGEASGGKVELTVEGEISGGEHNIVLNNTASLDDVNITVWKVDTSDNKPVVEAFTGYGENTYGTNDVTKKAEQSINYIISVQSDVSIASGTRKVNGYDTAHQDETVTFAVTVPSGYEIENFYNVSPGNIISLNKGSADGTYLLTVPRGGGVDIGVSLKKLQDNTSSSNIQVTPSADNVSRTESGASDGEYWSPGYNNSNVNAGGVYVGYDTTQLQGLQVHSMSIGGDVAQNITDVLTPVDTLTAFNNFEGTSLASIDMNNVMGSGIVNFNDLFIYSISDTVEVPVTADVYANQSYTVMFSDGTSMVVTCAMNGVLNIPFSKNAKGLTYIIYKAEVNPAMFMGMPEATGWTY